ncbi:964_t:CDS:2 [Diversispora eburnea]|uniref:964_t:CDS:1 n=1 Tax=Diversispora eburnea TaxID=1213867 RepID=A0A9N8W220_9GLOM|nr:964_t:CDS:2 [Diversispora eburnea]
MGRIKMKIILSDSILIEKAKLLATELSEVVLANEVSIEEIFFIALCANANKLYKLLPLIIEKYANSRCFKTINVHNLSITYQHNSKAWMLTTLFQEWLCNFDQKVAIKHNRQCVLLLLDNCGSHKIEGLDLSHVDVYFLPPNTTSRMQPMDVRIIIYSYNINNENNSELTNNISKNIQALYLPNAIGIEEFLSVPEENIIYKDLEDDEIITELVDIFKKPEENIKNVEELDDSIEPVIIDISVTLKSIENIYMFLFQQENSEKYIKLANTIEKFIKDLASTFEAKDTNALKVTFISASNEKSYLMLMIEYYLVIDLPEEFLLPGIGTGILQSHIFQLKRNCRSCCSNTLNDVVLNGYSSS